MNQTEQQSDIVVLLHGLGGTRLDMWRMAGRLKRLGFTVKNFGYRSVGNRIETHAERLGDFLSGLCEQHPGTTIHLVTHSMGGIITRTMLTEHDFDCIGRIVMITPPHQGSHAARKLNRYIGWLTPSLLQLSDVEDSFVNLLPNSLSEKEIEFAIIESTKDRVIAQGGVILDGYCDYAKVNAHHGIAPLYNETITLVEDFLVNGKFNQSPSQSPVAS